MYDPYNMYNPYYNNYNYNQQLQQIPRQNQQMYKQQNIAGLQGKVVDSLDVVKATDIPYDGSVSYFPLTDHSAIITKQLQQDGTSKVVIYRPISNEEIEKPKYITETDFAERIKNINSKDIQLIKDDIQELKMRLEDMSNNVKYKREK